MRRWKEYFTMVLICIKVGEVPPFVNRRKIIPVINTLKRSIATGLDSLLAELFIIKLAVSDDLLLLLVRSSSLHMFFIDFEKSFDIVKSEGIWSALCRRGILKKLVTIIRAIL